MQPRGIGTYLSNNTTMSEYGLNFDSKGCWESTEDHFMCLDKANDVYGRHFYNWIFRFLDSYPRQPPEVRSHL